jgi:hypothetical protein
VCFEVEDSGDSVAADSLLVDRAFNHVNRVLNRFIPLVREVRIFPLPAISSLARDPGGLCGMVDRTMNG